MTPLKSFFVLCIIFCDGFIFSLMQSQSQCKIVRGWFPLINKRTLSPPIFGSKVNGPSLPVPVHCWPYTVLHKSRMAIIWLMWHVTFLLTLAYFMLDGFKTTFIYWVAVLSVRTLQRLGWILSSEFPRVKNQDLISSWRLWKRTGPFRLLAEFEVCQQRLEEREVLCLLEAARNGVHIWLFKSSSRMLCCLYIQLFLLQLNEKQQQKPKTTTRTKGLWLG